MKAREKDDFHQVVVYEKNGILFKKNVLVILLLKRIFFFQISMIPDMNFVITYVSNKMEIR